MRELEKHPVDGSNSLWKWTNVRSPLRVTFNLVLMEIARLMPLRVKNLLYRLMGIELGERVSIALYTAMDIFFPELIEIGDDTIIGYDTVILTHEFLQDEWRRGPVIIGDRVMIGANCTILAGTEIGDDATVKAGTVVDRDVPEDAKAHGNPMVIE